MENIKAYLPLCWFSEDILRLPTSREFFKRNIFFYFSVMFFIQFNMSDDIESIFEVILETIFSLAFVWGILAINQLADSFTQICTAILFVQNAVSTLITPVVFWVTAVEDAASYISLSLLLFLGFALVARVFRQVLFINTAAAIVVSLSYFVVAYGGAYGLYSLIAG